uniref:Uncharacterized protein n=1 Tax=Anguilla anguilla TaxID=7936 RepID=A0A0E9PF03_ANGAN
MCASAQRGLTEPWFFLTGHPAPELPDGGTQ